ncbi:gliding motility-associated ABC transporter substrate-binding protein GldG [Sphingobacterium hungaricum]|uniref:Gliding motility-associated ABC transporter substrate-binding protein GldG n=1 Tax=Sphingobacterium hungaricum TaxID=2082723 RepID=A0A928YR04_9SPHI|nr:gliding motility-associated ABC transporter substrate-binding protein GldG [Sphingobacterium hungaricum]MBE8712858.1 gliding motility-associated ABC transporter substrate-binding protein GldG [Sphingobacterium hungaricum]
MFSIYKRETASYFNSLIGYLAIGIFLIVTGLVTWVFPDTSILDAGFASLEGFFSISPYLFMFLIPAISMRTIAGEKADGTYELLLSRPVEIKKIILAKFFACVTITALAILPTCIYAISIYLLANPVGNIDLGATIGSYIGLLLLSFSFVAIGIFCSSLTKNSILAFLTAVFVSFIFYDGFNSISQLSIFTDSSEQVKELGIQEHYNAISRGVLTVRDFIYFLSITSFFLLLSVGHLNRKFQKRKKTLLTYAGVIIVLIVLNCFVAPQLTNRIDFTQDKRYTLSNTTKNTIKEIDDDIYITLFLDGNLPSGFNRLKNSAIDMIADLRSYSDGKVKYNVINPLEGSQQEQQEFTTALTERGLYPTNLNVKSEDGFSQKLIFPWAIVGNAEHEIAVNLLQNKTGLDPNEVLNNSVQNLEYAFISSIKKVTAKEVPFIGFTEGHGEPTDLELYDAMQSLMGGNQVGRVNLDSTTYESLKQLSVLFVVKPLEKFSESDKYKIDYFVRNGGKVVWALDQVNASLDNLRVTGSQSIIGRDLNLDDLLFLYGARFNYNLVADLNCSQIPITMAGATGQSQIELAPWYFFPILMPTSQNPIVKNLDGIRTEFIGTLDTIANAEIKKEIVLSSSPFTRIINTPNSISLQMVEEQPDPKTFRTAPAPVAMTLSGKFPYLFKDRPTPVGISEAVDLSATSQESKMFLIADGDWLINQVNAKDQSPYPLGWDRYSEQQFANKILLENVVDYLLNDESLIQLRNREIKLRLLNASVVKSEKVKWQVINVLFPIVVLVLFGLIQHYLRKRKFGKKTA